MTGGSVEVCTTVMGGRIDVMVKLTVNVALEVWTCSCVAVVVCSSLVVVVMKFGGGV